MKTINLLPKARQQELRYDRIFHGSIKLLTLALLSFVLVFAVQAAARLYLQEEYRATQARIAALRQQVNKDENASLRNEVKSANDIVADYKNLSDQAPRWSKVLKAFSALPPQGIAITSFAADAKTKQVQISGRSPTRDLVIQLYNNILADSKEFKGIDYPLENVSKPANVNFHFTFTIQDSLLAP